MLSKSLSTLHSLCKYANLCPTFQCYSVPLTAPTYVGYTFITYEILIRSYGDIWHRYGVHRFEFNFSSRLSLRTSFSYKTSIYAIFCGKRDDLPLYLAKHWPLTGAVLSPHKQRSLESLGSLTQLVLCRVLQSVWVLHSRPFTRMIRKKYLKSIKDDRYNSWAFR